MYLFILGFSIGGYPDILIIFQIRVENDGLYSKSNKWS